MKPGDLIEHTFKNAETDRDTFFHYDLCNRHGNKCRTVVKKERFEEQWPEDPEFKAFADLLANSVQKALFDGFEIKQGHQCFGLATCCPLGALPSTRSAGRRAPGGYVAEASNDVSFVFAGVFDGGEGDTSNPYVRLALAYRKRFVKEKGE